MKRMISLMLAVLMLLSLVACGKSTEPTWQEQYDLGVRYLSEGNYEEAIIAFTAAIEIDPKREEAYVGLADVYYATGDTVKAEEILKERDRECGLVNTNEFTYGRRIKELFEAGYQGDGLTINDVTFMGRSIIGLDIMTMENILREKGFGISTNQDDVDSGNDDYYWFGADSVPEELSSQITALQYFSSQTVDSWGYTHRDNYDGEPLPIGLCDIYTFDSIETVLEKLGFNNGEEIVALLYELASVTYPNVDTMYDDLDEARTSFWWGTIQLGGGGRYIDYENSEEVQWRGAHDANCSMGFHLQLYGNEDVDYVSFSFENGALENVDYS